MLIESFLGRFVVIGTNAQNAVDSLEVARLQLLDDGCGIIAATTHEDGYATAYQTYDCFLDLLFFLRRQCWRLASRSQDAQEVSAVVELILDKTDKCLIVH